MVEQVQLNVRIYRSEARARFSGSGTFDAKEIIKSIGPARWLRDVKAWEVCPFQMDSASLRALFSEMAIEITEDEDTSAARDVVPAAGGVSAPTGVSVSQFLWRARTALQSAFPETILLYGVVSKAKEYGGRIFLDLAEKDHPDESVSCVVWETADLVLRPLREAGFQLEANLEVMLEAAVGLDRRNGRISLTVRRFVVEYTIAKVQALREATNKRLQAEGLFDRNRALSLPCLPRVLAVLTSTGGTVINDFRAGLDEARFGFDLLWLHTAVQGSGAAEEIVRGIDYLAKLPNIDAILLFRGGGSAADLAVFNDYTVARAICLCPLPVLSAIGHQEDQSSAQDVSNQSFGVPKDIGLFFAKIVLDLRARLADCIERTQMFADLLSGSCERELAAIAKHIPSMGEQFALRVEERFRRAAEPLLVSAARALDLRAQAVEHRGAQIERGAKHLRELADTLVHTVCERVFSLLERSIERSEEVLERFTVRLNEASPSVQLKRGFAIVRTESGGLATAREQLKADQPISIEFKDGEIRAVVARR